jgi:hypothetical protein
MKRSKKVKSEMAELFQSANVDAEKLFDESKIKFKVKSDGIYATITGLSYSTK